LRSERQRVISESEESSNNSDFSNIKRKIKSAKLIEITPNNLINTTNSSDELQNNSNNEENVFNEVDMILSELIYNHITNNEKKNESDVLKFHKQVKLIIL